ncbi:hypothetical protein DFH09DRAFT_1321808 [Mycena vulgaris]|nr:hypothetical protein DFH09DRAFT_1321808 [Mycena vulgaris]
MTRPPPLKSKYPIPPTPYQSETERRKARNEKARKRAELKARPAEEQKAAAERSRAYQATYREKNRRDLRIWEAQRRLLIYKEKYGPEAYQVYAKARYDRKKRAMARARAKEAYHSGDDTGNDDSADGGR